MLLILTDQYDEHANYVITKLQSINVSFFRFNLDVESLKNAYLNFYNDIWTVSCNNKTIRSNDISCVWCRRPFVELTLQEQQITDTDFKIWKNEWNKTLLGFYNSIKNCPWLNPLRKAYKGENKYFQMEVAKRVGFNLPETLVSNRKDDIVSFVTDHKKALLKLMSQEIYTGEYGEYLGFYTNIITEEDANRFGEIAENPIVLQEYVEKDYEVRYTVVGKEHLVCRIDSQLSSKSKYDWRRYDIAHTPHSQIIPPENVRTQVNHFMKLLSLDYGAIDFIVTPSGKWVFLEINCMGQWLWIEQLTGIPIADAIVAWIKKNI